MKYKGVIFDLYGTLVDPFRSAGSRSAVAKMAEALVVLATELGRLWSETHSDRETGVFGSIEENLRQLCESMSVRCGDSQVKKAAAVRLDLYRRSLVPRDGTLESLTALRSEGYRIGLVSNASVQTPELWRETAMAPLVDVPIFSSEAKMSKPDQRIYQLAYEGLGLAAEECLYVGDGSSGELAGAQRAGLNAVLIRVPGDDLDDPFRPEAKTWQGQRVSSIPEVLDLVAA